MRDHDVESEQAVDPARQREAEPTEAPAARDVAQSIAAGRPDALGPAGLMHLQRTAGNSGVGALMAQRSAAQEEQDAAAGASASASPVHDVVSGGGRPLDPGLRSSMEASLGHDFGSVRVHDDSSAASSAKSVQAHAYTVGEHVVFGEGRYQPDSTDGRRTLAHELTHVVQQRQGPVDGTPQPGGIQVSHPDDPFEREAESVADRVMSTPAPESEPTSTAAEPAVAAAPVSTDAPVQRQAAEEEEEPAEAQAAAEPATEQAAAEGGPAEEAPAQEDAAAAASAASDPAALAEKGDEEEESVAGG
jgi:hypothetical protein